MSAVPAAARPDREPIAGRAAASIRHPLKTGLVAPLLAAAALALLVALVYVPITRLR